MKKLVTFVLTMMLFASMSLSVFATSGSFVPSITQKAAPAIVATEEVTEDGQKIIGTVVIAGTNEEVHKAVEGTLLVTAITEVDDADHLTEEKIEELQTIFEEFSNGTQKLSETSEAFVNHVKEVLGEDKSADDLVIKDLFDVTITSEELENHLAQEDTRINLTFDAGLEKDQFVAVMLFKNNEWLMAENATNNGDGTVTATFDHFCPVMIIVEEADAAEEEAKVEAPATEEAPAEEVVEAVTEAETSASFPWWIVIVVAVIAIVVVLKGRKKADK